VDKEITQLEHPIDVMYLIHRALKAEARLLEEMVQRFRIGESLQPFRAVFNLWASALIFHADQEDRYMTAPMTDLAAARDNEAEHDDLGKGLSDLASFLGKNDRKGLEARVKEAILALHEQQHMELMEKLEDVMAVLNQEIGKTRVIARTHRHLYGKVVALRIAQEDHFESEEAFILPEIYRRFSQEEQLKVVERLLTDESAEDSRWVLDWVAQYLTPVERQVLADLEASWAGIAVRAG
jgi:hypothetical protein